jgi:hypothetical protein
VRPGRREDRVSQDAMEVMLMVAFVVGVIRGLLRKK